MHFRPLDPPTGNQSTDDPFAEFPSESAKPAEAPKNRDWLAEFPDEKAPTPAVRSKDGTRNSTGGF